MLGRRKIERFEISLPVCISTDKKVFDGLLTSDVSSEGVFVLSNTPLELKSKVDVSIFGPFGGGVYNNTKTMINATGKVVRVESRGFAVHFDENCRFFQIEQ